MRLRQEIFRYFNSSIAKGLKELLCSFNPLSVVICDQSET